MLSWASNSSTSNNVSFQKDGLHGLAAFADLLRDRKPEPGDCSFHHLVSNCYGFRQTQ